MVGGKPSSQERIARLLISGFSFIIQVSSQSQSLTPHRPPQGGAHELPALLRALLDAASKSELSPPSPARHGGQRGDCGYCLPAIVLVDVAAGPGRGLPVCLAWPF